MIPPPPPLPPNSYTSKSSGGGSSAQALTANYYPPPAFAFAVSLASTWASATTIDAQFQEVSGIDPKVELEELRVGGVNDYVYQLPGVTKHSNLMLKRGFVTQTSRLANWALQSVGSTLGDPIVTQVLTVSLLGPSRTPIVTWTLANAWPVKWEVGHFDSMRNEVLTETMEIAYTTVTRQLVKSS